MSLISSPRRASPWRWVSIFVVLAVLGTAGVTLPIVYNLNQQLKPEQLSQARRRWRTAGPMDYDLTYRVTYDRNSLGERHIVLVRGGEVVFASCEGEVVTLSPALSAAAGLPIAAMSQVQARDIPAIFAHIEDLFKMDEEAPRRNFLVAVFDPHKGHPRRIVHRIRGTDTRESWDLLLWPAGALASPEAMALAGEGDEAMNAGLRALLTGLIDYAGLFPPAKLPMDQAVRNYLRYREEPESWMLGRFICPAARLGELAAFQEEIPADRPLVVSVLARGGETEAESRDNYLLDVADLRGCERATAFRDPATNRQKHRVVIDMSEARLPAEVGRSPAAVPAWVTRGLAGVVFFEVPGLSPHAPDILAAIRRVAKGLSLTVGCKIRCGGLEASAFPSSEQVANVLCASVREVLPLKATAGLHHPFPRFDATVNARMHGFINLFAAGVFAWHRGIDAAQAAAILDDDLPSSFVFDDSGMRWRDLHATVAEIHTARTAFVVSFGSCSFDEPRDDLRALRWL